MNRFAWVSYVGEFPFLLVPFQGDGDAEEDPPDEPVTPDARLGELLRDYSPEDLRRQGSNVLPKLHGALLKNEQDVHLFERLAFMARGNR